MMRYIHFYSFLFLVLITSSYAEANAENYNNSNSESIESLSSKSKDKVEVAAKNKDKILEEKSSENSSKDLKLASIDVTGVQDDLKKNIELHMPVTIPECNAERAEVKLFFNTVKKNLRKASRALGYYDAEFSSGGSIVNNCWKLRLKIKSGRPTKVISQKINVVGSGKNQESFQTILSKPPYKIGDALNHKNYSEFKNKLSETSQALGYFDAEFDQHSIRIDPASYQARVSLILNTGERYAYGKVSIDQTILSDKAVQKYLILKEGVPFNAEDLIRQQQILQRSGYYKTITIDVLHDQVTHRQVPIKITLSSKKRNAYKFKVGYGSDTGARVSAELDRRWTGQKGRHFNIKTQYSETLSGISLKLNNPRKKPEDNSLVYNIDWSRDSNDDVVSKIFDVGATLVRKQSSEWVHTASINILSHETDVGGVITESDLLLFGIGLEKISADSLIFPTNGWRLNLSLKAASEHLLSDQDVVQFKVQAKGIMKFGPGKLLGRSSYGGMIVHDFNRLPKNLRFFAGGGNSVRGYGSDSLGELNSDNKVRGGKQLIDLSLEYQHPIVDAWSAAVFIDAGNAFDDFKDVDLKVGTGFGARWRSPFGPVRIDLGFPLDSGDAEDPKLYLSIGSDL